MHRRTLALLWPPRLLLLHLPSLHPPPPPCPCPQDLCRALTQPRGGAPSLLVQLQPGAATEGEGGAEDEEAGGGAAAAEGGLCAGLTRQVPLVASGEGNHLTLRQLMTDTELMAEITQARPPPSRRRRPPALRVPRTSPAARTRSRSRLPTRVPLCARQAEAADLQLYQQQLELQQAGGELRAHADADAGGGAATPASDGVIETAAALLHPRRRKRNSSSVAGWAPARSCLPSQQQLCAAPPCRAEGTCSAAGGAAAAIAAATAAAPPRRRWADEHAGTVAALQRLVPPKASMALLFTHIPKCAGSSFRNSLLFEFTRLRRAKARTLPRATHPPQPLPRPHPLRLWRAQEDFACVFYRDVHFVETARENSSLARQGPDCLDADGMLPPRIRVVTGHIGFQARAPPPPAAPHAR